MSGSPRPAVRPRTALLAASLATAPALLLGTAALAATTPLAQRCGVSVDVPLEAATARVAVTALPGLTPVAIAEDGVLTARGTVEVPLDPAQVRATRVRVVLTVDGTEQPPVDLDVPACADSPAPSSSPGATPAAAPSDDPSAAPTASPTTTPVDPPTPSPTTSPTASPAATPAPATATVTVGTSAPAAPRPAAPRPPAPQPPASQSPSSPPGAPVALSPLVPLGTASSGAVPLGGTTGAAATLPLVAPEVAALAPLVGAPSGAAAAAVPPPQVAGQVGALGNGLVLALPEPPPAPLTVLTTPSSALPTRSTTPPPYADLVPAGVLLAGSLGGLVAFARRRWI